MIKKNSKTRVPRISFPGKLEVSFFKIDYINPALTFTVREEHIGSVVTEILSYMHTHRQTETLTDKQTFCYILQELAATHIEAFRVKGGIQLPILPLN